MIVGLIGKDQKVGQFKVVAPLVSWIIIVPVIV